MLALGLCPAGPCSSLHLTGSRQEGVAVLQLFEREPSKEYGTYPLADSNFNDHKNYLEDLVKMGIPSPISKEFYVLLRNQIK